MPIVSIIIPICNAELYIEQCLDSLLKQSFTEYEIICVDDGSEDHSYDILKKFEKTDSRIKVFSQKNQFAGVARNVGMEKAVGKYLLFLDADDFFENNLLEKIVNTAEKENIEILLFDAYRFDDVSKEVIKEPWHTVSVGLFGTGIKSAMELSDVIFQITAPSPWNKLFLKEYIEKNDLKYQTIQKTNDLCFVYSALSQAERIGILNQKLVYYRVNNQNSLQGSTEKESYSFSDALFGLKEFLEERKSWDKFKNSFYTLASEVFINNLSNMQSETRYKLLCNKIKCDLIPRLGIKFAPIDKNLKKIFDTGKKVVIYGAGAVAGALIQCLIFQYKYDRSKIKIAVTNAADNRKALYGIRIHSIHTLHLDKDKELLIIAVSEKNLQNEMEEYAQKLGFMRIVKIDYNGIMELLLGDKTALDTI